MRERKIVIMNFKLSIMINAQLDEQCVKERNETGREEEIGTQV